ncbi:MAG: glycosyltransferase family 4 protein [Actinomycetota bacterium]|jgi:glycosyltransferase involved in cell wall biosynthesis
MLRIAEVAPPYLPVPPTGYGGIELVVALLANGLVARGHDVTLFASPESHTAARLVSPIERPLGPSDLVHDEYDMLQATSAHLRAEDFDVVHDHTVHGPALAALQPDGPPVIHTLHGPWTDAARTFYGGLQHHVHLVAISETQRADNPDVTYAGVVPNGIDVEQYPLREDKEERLVFMGRCNREKGPELAVQVAARAGLPLTMVVKRAEPEEQRYWDEAVVPHLTGNEEIIEAVGHDEKIDLFGRALGVLMPVQWHEPFGLVMAEAMACGTPVIAQPLGAAQEVVADGETGFLREGADAMAEAVSQLSELSARACRDRVVRHFSAEVMVNRYEEIFERAARSPSWV